MLGDNETYISCTGHDYQEVLSWTDTSIQIIFNAPIVAYPEASESWLFVIDDNGNESSGNGGNITIGISSEAPGRVTGISAYDTSDGPP